MTLPGLIGVAAAAASDDSERVQMMHDCLLSALVRAGHSQKTAAAALSVSQAQLCRDLLTLARLMARFSRLGVAFTRSVIASVLEAQDANYRRTA